MSGLIGVVGLGFVDLYLDPFDLDLVVVYLDLVVLVVLVALVDLVVLVALVSLVDLVVLVALVSLVVFVLLDLERVVLGWSDSSSQSLYLVYLFSIAFFKTNINTTPTSSYIL